MSRAARHTGGGRAWRPLQPPTLDVPPGACLTPPARLLAASPPLFPSLRLPKAALDEYNYYLDTGSLRISVSNMKNMNTT